MKIKITKEHLEAAKDLNNKFPCVNSMSNHFVSPTSHEANKWCLLGALSKVCNINSELLYDFALDNPNEKNQTIFQLHDIGRIHNRPELLEEAFAMMNKFDGKIFDTLD